MPTKKPAKKRAPRMDWKALAMHRGEALTVMADVNRAQSDKITQLADELSVSTRAQQDYYRRMLAALNSTAAAEKHNAILPAEREARETATVRKRPYCLLCYRIDCDGNESCVPPTAIAKQPASDFALGGCADHEPSPTLYQRLKSWAAKWSVEIACALAVLAVFALASWYALRWGK